MLYVASFFSSQSRLDWDNTYITSSFFHLPVPCFSLWTGLWAPSRHYHFTPYNWPLMFLEASLAQLSSGTCWLLPVTFAFTCSQTCLLHRFPREHSEMVCPVISQIVFLIISEDESCNCLPPVNPDLTFAHCCSSPPWRQAVSPASSCSLHRVTEHHKRAYWAQTSSHCLLNATNK